MGTAYRPAPSHLEWVDASFETMDEARAHIKEQTHPNNTRISAGSHRCTHSALHSFGPKVVERWTIIKKRRKTSTTWCFLVSLWHQFPENGIKVYQGLTPFAVSWDLEMSWESGCDRKRRAVQPVPILPGDDMGWQCRGRSWKVCR